MPITISVGLSKKIGLPNYGSLGANCNVQFEAVNPVLASDLDGFHQQVRCAFAACRQAVEEELCRQQQANRTELEAGGQQDGGRSSPSAQASPTAAPPAA